MRKCCGIGLALVLQGWIGAGAAHAVSDNLSVNSSSGNSSSDNSSSGDFSSSKALPVNCRAPDAPYRDYKCLDTHLGSGFLERLINYYRLEWGHSKAPEDPNAPEPRRKAWPEAPLTTPPYPFADWPYDGATSIGTVRPNFVDSPLMVALGNTDFGQMLKADHIQVYGWINGGGNISSNTVRPGGNFPISYPYTPNLDELDQAVVFVERLPDTVQKDHVDWGFRVSALYGENYRYTTAFGFASNQLHGHDLFNGYDSPVLYGEVFLPQFAEGLMVRFGRFFTIPDIESMTAPNNYVYIHSLTNTFDALTNTGVMGTLAINKNWILQFGVTCGSDTMCWNIGATVHNPFPNPVFPGASMLKDPGAQLSYTAGARWQSDSAWDSVYVVEDGINNGTWGYDNIQWTGLTWYHKFGPSWHLAWETYFIEQRNVLNITDPLGIIANGGYPFTPANGFKFNAPLFAQCDDPRVVACTARAFASVMYLNHQFSPLDNLTFDVEFFDDMQGQRTGTKTRYVDFGLGWQHWFSPQIEIRPEIDYYRSLGPPAFNGNSNAIPVIPPNKRDALLTAADVIVHF